MGQVKKWSLLVYPKGSVELISVQEQWLMVNERNGCAGSSMPLS